jgi:hypothetical protein
LSSGFFSLFFNLSPGFDLSHSFCLGICIFDFEEFHPFIELIVQLSSGLLRYHSIFPIRDLPSAGFDQPSNSRAHLRQDLSGVCLEGGINASPELSLRTLLEIVALLNAVLDH